jgi:hypothetical protein
MNIYHSTKPAPYVYICTHKITNQFYIGYREQNVKHQTVSHIDFPTYCTSNKNIKKSFDEYNWEIVAEFLSGNDAYDYEQWLIYYYWNNPLLINKQCCYGKPRFKSIAGFKHTDKTKQSISIKNKGRITSDETRSKISASLVGRPMSNEQKKKQSETMKGCSGMSGSANPMYGKRGELNPMYGIPRLAATKKKISEATTGKQAGRIPHNKGIPHSDETKQKIKQSSIGRIQSLNTRELISTSKKGIKQKIVTCPHCNVTGGVSNLKRWHFENCKLFRS